MPNVAENPEVMSPAESAPLMNPWQKVFQLDDGHPTGRWQWSLETIEGEYRYPGRWVEPDAIVPLPDEVSC